MFPLHQGKKLVFQISSSNNPHHDQISSEDRIFGYASPDRACSSVLSNTNINTGESRRRKFAAAASDHTIIENNSKDGKNKMVIHRESERLRRQEMANLCISLRSLLPLEFIKGKRSTSDHMNEAVNYIKHLQNRIITLGAKRDKLEKFPILTSSTAAGRDGTAGSSSNNWVKGDEPSCFRIQPCCGGVQIVISSGSGEDGASPLISISSISKILEMLLEQGLNVVSCVSSKVNERVVHTIQSEVDEIESVDMYRLEKKLAEELLSSRCISK